MFPPATPAPDPMGASTPPAPGPSSQEPITLTPAQVAAWRRRITADLEGTKDAIAEAKTNIDRYKNKHLGRLDGDTVAVPSDFYYTEQKKSQLLFRLPDVYLKADQPGLEDSGVIFQHALNKKIGPNGVNLLPRAQEVIFDVICATGYGALKTGVEIIQDGTTPMEITPAGVDPLTGQPTPPVMTDAPNIIATRYFIERIAPGDLGVPAGFTGSDFDEAPYLFARFREDLPDDTIEGRAAEADDDRRLTPLSPSAQTSRRKQRIGHEVWFKGRAFLPDQVKHPDAIWTFVLYDDDRQTPVIAKPSPYQEVNPQTGKYEGMVGYPIAPLTIRYISDTWMAPSDCSMARNTADEMSKGRTQMLRGRDRNQNQWGFDATRLDKDIQAKIEKNETFGGIGFNGAGADVTWPIVKGSPSRETFTFDEICRQDLNRIWGITDQGTGVQSDTARTATELQLTNAASQSRMESDRARVTDWLCQKVIAKFAALLQLFADEVEYVELVGQDAQRLKNIPPEVQAQAQQTPQASVLVPWSKANIFGRYSFTIKPDSQLHLDVVQQREQWLKFFNFLANEPTANRTELTREGMKLFNYDPARFTQPPPPHAPEPPKSSFSFTGPDLVAPQAAMVVELLQQLGFKISPQAILQAQQMLLQQEQLQAAQDAAAGAQTEHGGAALEAKKINKHPTEATGGLQGTGQPAPMGAPDGTVM